MGKIQVFNFTTVNGFFKGPNDDISWAHRQQQDKEFAEEGANAGGILLFGRVTYQMMASYWPTPLAEQNDAKVAEGMNKAEKIVFSNTLKKADWKNTRIISGDIITQVSKLKEASTRDMTILGSGSIVTQLSNAGLIDEYQFLIHPLAIGEGTPLLQGIDQPIALELINTKPFKSGSVLLTYRPSDN